MRIGEILSVERRRLSAARRRESSDLDRAWQAAAGPALSPHTRVRAAFRGILTVEVDSAPRCSELAGFLKPGLIEAVNRQLGTQTIRDIRFRLGDFVSGDGPPTRGVDTRDR